MLLLYSRTFGDVLFVVLRIRNILRQTNYPIYVGDYRPSDTWVEGINITHRDKTGYFYLNKINVTILHVY